MGLKFNIFIHIIKMLESISLSDREIDNYNRV